MDKSTWPESVHFGAAHLAGTDPDRHHDCIPF